MENVLAFINWTVDPVAFSIGSLEVRWYGILLATGFILAYFTLKKIFITEKLSQGLLDKLSIWTIIWTIVGLRLGHFLFYETEYLVSHPLQVLLPFDEDWNFVGYQGLASHGAVIAIILWLTYFSWKKKMNFFWLIDRLAIAIPIAAAFVRIGNLMNHEIVGSITNVNWAFNFTQGGPGIAGTFRHPAQLYESIVYLLLFLALVLYYLKFAKGNVPAGRTTGIVLTVIFIARFFIEFFKEVQVVKEEAMTLNIGQLLSIPFILIGVGLLIWSFIKKDNIPHYIEPKTPENKDNKTK
ncbi:MAG: prolipoprotein diacylglyceryl transferase [Bacteroidales bacterium]|jgi:phosphatidylglycerol---prolipoprotein diacylglyceryl transferase|nr:prolipoprotein diacylglyceryl transferase [Bacteroidales bacterium]MDD4395244.1 prolipoprotein diacylglyceryl transferase [Bacteroidales bacterium]